MSRDFNTENVYQAYSGKNGCCCGCLGKHYYSSKHKDFVDVQKAIERGCKIDDRMIAKISEKVKSLPEDIVTDEMISCLEGEKLYIVYLRKEKTI